MTQQIKTTDTTIGIAKALLCSSPYCTTNYTQMQKKIKFYDNLAKNLYCYFYADVIYYIRLGKYRFLFKITKRTANENI